MNTDLETLRYPIGRFIWPSSVSEQELQEALNRIETFPGRIQKTVENLLDDQLDTPYRPDGWTIRQVIHHVADSHMNAYIRLKLALTEDTPTIKPYDESKWAMLPDSITLHPEISLRLLKDVHTRWVVIMKCMPAESWDRTFIHPEYNKTYSLRQFVRMYAWHGDHHLAHITGVLKRMDAEK